jgi:lipopolysaccharide/colanic/teichoic acid biosynthesis glycosyltransferase
MMIKHKIAGQTSSLMIYTWWKGMLDRLLALLLLIILSPVMVFVAIAIRIDSPGNPIFCQERVGKDGCRFIFYKFRSMYQNHDDSKYHAYWKKYIQENSSSLFDEKGQDVYELIHDPRITRFGSLIRWSSLDELPQLINVLKGDMSFVGPRPDVAFALKFYQDHHWKRFQVKPGITGLWQVFENRRRIGFEDMVSLDIDYINRQSLLLDTKIALLTARELLSFGGRQKEVGEVKMTNGIKA